MLRIFEHVSLDGVVQHTADENGFACGDWTVAYRSPEGREAITAAQGPRYDLLLGRRTYDLWSDSWPKAPGNPLSDSINAATKHVATHRPESLRWGPCEGIGPDLAADVRRIKAQDGPDLVLWGSSTLTSTLFEHGLVDEVVLAIYPVLLGSGKRLFAEGTPPRALALVGTQATPTGIVINTYKVAGPLQAGA